MTTFDTTATRSTGRGDHEARDPQTVPSQPVRWGPAWTGALVALPVFLVLQLLFVAFGWLSLGVSGPDAGVASGIVSAVLAIIALFVGGLAGGTASGSNGLTATAALQGAMIWALTVVALLLFGVVGGGVLAGSVGGLATPSGDPASTVQAVQDGAGWAALWLGVAFVAAILGSTTGAGISGDRTGGARSGV